MNEFNLFLIIVLINRDIKISRTISLGQFSLNATSKKDNIKL